MYNNKTMNIAILGYGVEGKTAEKFLRKEFKSVRIDVRDIKIQGKDYLNNLNDFDMVVRSPGIPYLLPEIQKAKKDGVKITSTTKLFFENARGLLVGITGTKGKGTTATLLYKILRATKKDAHLIGNMGIPMLDELPKLKKNSISILELSSFQLQDMDISPNIAVVLDVSPDHLNYHKSMKEYVDAKSNLVKNNLSRHQTFQDTDIFLLKNSSYSRQSLSQVPEKFMSSPICYFFPDNKYSKQIAQKGKGKKIPVLADRNLVLKIPGAHNLKNASIAAVVARTLGSNEKVIKRVIKNFKGLPHRIEFVREINGIRFYNDSASTNPAATVAALQAFKEPKILIAGGAGKNLNYSPIREALKNSNTKLVVLNGENQNAIGRAIGRAVPIIYVKDLKSAVKIAFKRAQKGDVIVLSPASTGFDQFSGYGERGENFKRIVKLIKR